MGSPMKMWRGIVVTQKIRKIRQSVDDVQNEMLSRSPHLQMYNDRMRAKREQLQQRVQQLYSQIKSPQMIELFLIAFSTIGAKMVEPAADWLTGWGEGLKRHGFIKLGEELVKHAKDEVGHEIWHQNDVGYLVPRYNKKYRGSLDVTKILKEGDVSCVKHYRAAYEDSVNGQKELSCLGMLYETELMTFTLAPQFIGFCARELGFGILKGLSFLRGHLVSDVEHVRDNNRQLQEVLAATPDALAAIVHMGERTVDIYIEYFESAMELAKAKMASRSRGELQQTA